MKDKACFKNLEHNDDFPENDYGCIPMDISTDDDSEESKKKRNCSIVHNHEESKIRLRKILKAPRKLKKWKCAPCKTINENSAFCKICKNTRPQTVDFEIET
jgi:hypothetical protein